jgi:gas vesicle structural protein
MTVQSYAGRAPRPSSLADVLELVLDKGLVIDAYVRVSLVGIELLTIDARIVVASVDTYLRFAEATNRLDLQAASNSEGLPQMIGDLTEGGASHKTKGALSGAAEEVSGWLGGGGDDDDEGSQDGEEERSNGDGRRRRPARASADRSERRGRDGASRRPAHAGNGQRRRRPADDEER